MRICLSGLVHRRMLELRERLRENMSIWSRDINGKFIWRVDQPTDRPTDRANERCKSKLTSNGGYSVNWYNYMLQMDWLTYSNVAVRIHTRLAPFECDHIQTKKNTLPICTLIQFAFSLVAFVFHPQIRLSVVCALARNRVKPEKKKTGEKKQQQRQCNVLCIICLRFMVDNNLRKCLICNK